MAKYEIIFSGVKLGAIGLSETFRAYRDADTPEGAIRALYDEYEHIHTPRVREVPPLPDYVDHLRAAWGEDDDTPEADARNY